MRFLRGHHRPSDADQALIDEFGSWLKARAQQPRMVTRPQDCDCGASQVAMVAHGVNCKSRARRTPLATPTPVATHGPRTTGRIDLPPMPLPPGLPADE